MVLQYELCVGALHIHSASHPQFGVYGPVPPPETDADNNCKYSDYLLRWMVRDRSDSDLR